MIASNEIKQAQRSATLRAFANAYVVMTSTVGMRRATRAAAKVVGIKSIATAKAYLKDPVCKVEIQKGLEAAASKYKKTADDVLDEISSVAYSNIADIFERAEGDGIKLKNLLDLPPVIQKVIKKVKHTQKITETGSEDNPVRVVENHFEYELNDKLRALHILAQYHKLVNREAEGGGEGDVEKIRFYLPHNNRNPVVNLIEDAEFKLVEVQK